jgi:hypothetical protein
VGRLGPLLLHAVVGAVVIGFAAQIPCGSDECLSALYTGVSAGVWAVTAPVAGIGARAGMRELRLLAWLVPLLWPPIAWAAAFGLFLAFPQLGGA